MKSPGRRVAIVTGCLAGMVLAFGLLFHDQLMVEWHLHRLWSLNSSVRLESARALIERKTEKCIQGLSRAIVDERLRLDDPSLFFPPEVLRCVRAIALDRYMLTEGIVTDEIGEGEDPVFRVRLTIILTQRNAVFFAFRDEQEQATGKLQEPRPPTIITMITAFGEEDRLGDYVFLQPIEGTKSEIKVGDHILGLIPHEMPAGVR